VNRVFNFKNINITINQGVKILASEKILNQKKEEVAKLAEKIKEA